jgi:hypothetical protein
VHPPGTNQKRVLIINGVICDKGSMKDSDDFLRYDKMVESALRGVVKKSIEEVIDHGLTGDHHFYITFLTDFPGVKIPEYLRDRYPGEMTIVLQYQFEKLKVDDDAMQVTLSFNNVPENLKIPLASINIFADPSVNFALQFQPLGDSLSDADMDALDELEDGPDDDDKGGPGGGSGAGKGKKAKKTGEVVSLDTFRKK